MSISCHIFVSGMDYKSDSALLMLTALFREKLELFIVLGEVRIFLSMTWMSII